MHTLIILRVEAEIYVHRQRYPLTHLWLRDLLCVLVLQVGIAHSVLGAD